MKSRPTPRMTFAWVCDRRFTKRYANRSGVYYAIAKSLVVDKYPPWLSGNGYGEPDPTWSPELIEARRDKAQDLFGYDYSDSLGEFDQTKWKAFVRRVARFLAFVDRKRPEADRFDGYVGDKALADAFTAAERNATAWMDEAQAIQREQKRRAKVAP